jgi:NAD(P)-dependent dehydrogenase (short-subunit alcohol dehydrogenase family)
MRLPGEYADKVAIVTGSAQGIGRAYAEALAAEGAAVVCADRNEKGVAATAAVIRESGARAVAIGVDVADEPSTLDMAAQAASQFGGIDILVNNAAIYHSMRLDSMMQVDLAYWNTVMGVNVNGVLLCTRAVAAYMKERGRGKVVNQASGAAFMGGNHYGISKLAVVGMTAGFAKELGPDNITVNCIAPGVIDTEATRVTVPETILEEIVTHQSLRRRAAPSDLIGTLLYLTSSLSDFLTGATIVVDGGHLLRF